MSPSVPLWHFDPSVELRRAELLLSYKDFESVSELLSQGSIIAFEWESFHGKRLKGCHRASFLLKVAPETYDAFFNSPVGYRAQYALGPLAGESVNRKLLSQLEAHLLMFARGCAFQFESLLLKSLHATQSKIWIFEPEVQVQLGAEEPAILYQPWMNLSPDGAGLLAPIGEQLEIKGGWLDIHGTECLDPAKATRSTDIHEVGFS